MWCRIIVSLFSVDRTIPQASQVACTMTSFHDARPSLWTISVALLVTISVVAAVFVVPSSACAAQWFVRPASLPAEGSSNGTSYADAWEGLDEIEWDRIKPGDTLYVCDTHVGKPLILGASGADDNRITIRGDYEGHPGVILGASEVICGGWDLHDRQRNVWKRAFRKPANYSGFHAFARPKDCDPLQGLVRLDNVGEPKDAGTGVLDDFAQWRPGTYYFAEEQGTLYFMPRSGAANDYVYYAGYEPACVRSVHQSHFDLRNLTVMMGGGSKNQGVVVLSHADHAALDGLTVRWGSLGIVFGPNWADRLQEGAESENITVSNCTVYDCRCGIYPFGAVSNCRITDNHVHDIGQHGYYLPWKQQRWYGDIHGIAIQGGGNGLLIARNHVHHVGGEGIFPYADNNPNGVNCQEMRNFAIQYNLVHDCKYLGSSAKPTHASSGKQSALYYNQNNVFPSEAMSDNVMAYNIVYNAEHGVRLKCNANKQTGKAPWSVYNNLIHNIDVGVCWYSSGARNPHNKPGIVCKNNLILSAHRGFVQIATPTIKQYDQVIFDHNLYYPAIAEGGFAWPGATGDFGAWQAWTEGTRRDAHSLTADPKVVDADAANFHLRAGSPATDAGADVGFSKDFDNTKVPQGRTPDLGPHEYDGIGD